MSGLRGRTAGTLLATILMGVAACSSEAPVAPAVPDVAGGAAEQSVLGAPMRVNVLQRKTALAAPLKASVTVGLFGGSLSIPGAGMTMVIPFGAVTRTTTITATAMAGSNVAYEFGPHGTKFNVPLVINQDMRGTNTSGLDLSALFAGYFASASDISGTVGSITEVLSFGVNTASMVGVFSVNHFSGYLVATGKCRDRDFDDER